MHAMQNVHIIYLKLQPENPTDRRILKTNRKNLKLSLFSATEGLVHPIFSSSQLKKQDGEAKHLKQVTYKLII